VDSDIVIDPRLSDEVMDKVEIYFGFVKTAAELQEKRKSEHDLLGAFKKNPSKETFMPFYKSFKPLIMKAVQSNSRRSSIPQSVHTAQAAQSFLDATRTFDPSKGTFRTHAFGTILEKGKRLNLKYQNVGYIPEARSTKYQNYHNSLYLLNEELGREPSTIELADEMGVPVSEVESMRKEITKEYVSKDYDVRGPAFAQSDKALQLARDIMYTLPPKQQLVLELTLGLNGHQALLKFNGQPDIKAISKATGMNDKDIRAFRRNISKKFKQFRASTAPPSQQEALFEDDGED